MHNFKNPAKVLLILIVLFGIHKTINILYSPWIRTPAKYEINRDEFENASNQTSILFLGDSHTLASVDTDLVENSFVFASGGENYIQTYYKFKYYYETADLNLDLVILPIDLHIFSSFRTDRSQDPIYWNRYINYYELGLVKEELPTYLNIWLQGEITYLGGLDDVIDKILSKEEVPETPSDAPPAAVPEKGPDLTFDINKIQKIIRLQFINEDYIDEDLVIYFLKLLAYLEEQQIPTLLVWYPITSEYYNETALYIPADDHLLEINKLLADNGYSTPILDYSDLFWGQNQLFRDPHHLNQLGSEEFTTILISDLEILFNPSD